MAACLLDRVGYLFSSEKVFSVSTLKERVSSSTAFEILMQAFFSHWHLTLSSFVSEGERFGVGENVKEQERNSQRLQPYSCEYRFGYSLPLGRLQQANYQASVTGRERQKHRLTEANNTFQPQLYSFSSNSTPLLI